MCENQAEVVFSRSGKDFFIGGLSNTREGLEFVEVQKEGSTGCCRSIYPAHYRHLDFGDDELSQELGRLLTQEAIGEVKQ